MEFNLTRIKVIKRALGTSSFQAFLLLYKFLSGCSIGHRSLSPFNENSSLFLLPTWALPSTKSSSSSKSNQVLRHNKHQNLGEIFFNRECETQINSRQTLKTLYIVKYIQYIIWSFQYIHYVWFVQGFATGKLDTNSGALYYRAKTELKL